MLFAPLEYSNTPILLKAILAGKSRIIYQGYRVGIHQSDGYPVYMAIYRKVKIPTDTKSNLDRQQLGGHSQNHFPRNGRCLHSLYRLFKLL